MSTKSPWFADIANYLVTEKLPPHLSAREKWNIIQKSVAYSWIQGDLFYTGADLIIRICVREEQVFDILKSVHDEPCGGHCADKRTAYKVLQASYFWPSLFKDAKQYVKRCDSYQRIVQLNQTNEIPLCPQVMVKYFEKWTVDFVGPINPSSSNKRHILVCTNFVTKSVEAKAVSFATERVVFDFLFTEIFTRFDVPREIVSDNGSYVISNLVQGVMEQYKIQHNKSTPYHLQANG